MNTAARNSHLVGDGFFYTVFQKSAEISAGQNRGLYKAATFLFLNDQLNILTQLVTLAICGSACGDKTTEANNNKQINSGRGTQDT